MVNETQKSILILAPHTDDGELGCGASIAKFLEQGSNIFYVAFSTCKESIPKGLPEWTLRDELGASMASFGIPKENIFILDYPVRHFLEHRQAILDDMLQIRNKVNPDIVFMPSPHDVHQDHTAIALEGMRAFKGTSILGYELPWNNYTFNNQTFSKIEEHHVQQKVTALSNYKSQKNRNYFQKDYVYGMARAHGIQIGCDFAEVFETIRWVF